MKKASHHPPRRLAVRDFQRAGATMLELLVAGTLVMAALSVWAPLVVRHGRLAMESRHYRIAVDELSNQLERLAALPGDELAAAVEDLAVSEFAGARLPGAELNADLEPADYGQRLTLSMTWDEPQRSAAPLTMTAWVFPAGPTDAAPDEENEP
jgi:hypothetical protein